MTRIKSSPLELQVQSRACMESSLCHARSPEKQEGHVTVACKRVEKMVEWACWRMGVLHVGQFRTCIFINS